MIDGLLQLQQSCLVWSVENYLKHVLAIGYVLQTLCDVRHRIIFTSDPPGVRWIG